MRIALIYFGRRGAGGPVSFELTNQLSHEHEILVVLSTGLEYLPFWKNTSAKLLVVDTFRNAFQALFSILFLSWAKKLVLQISAFDPDVLIFPMFHPWNAIIQKQLKSVPSLVFVHDPKPHPDVAGWFYEKLENKSIHQAARCMVMSEALKPALLRRGVGLDNIDVIPIGPLAYVSSVNLKGKKQHPPVLLFFGRIAPYKGLETLLEAYRQVIGSFPCHLRIVGSGNIGPYKKMLAQMPNIEIVNRWITEEEIGDFFAQSDLVVLPYTSASQSGVIPIAATFGLPVIASHTGGLSEQIEDGYSGWLTPPGDVSALVDAISEALAHPDLARRRGQALKQRYEESFNWGQIANQVVSSLEKTMQARGPK